MKTIQKLEIGFGLATLVATLILLYLFASKAISDNHSDIIFESIISVVLLLILPAFLTGIGSIVHVVRQSRGGFITVLLGGTVLSLIFGLNFFSLAIFYFFGWVGGVIATTPALFALATVFAAMKSNKLLNAK